jgi:hypothetical protein
MVKGIFKKIMNQYSCEFFREIRYMEFSVGKASAEFIFFTDTKYTLNLSSLFSFYA